MKLGQDGYTGPGAESGDADAPDGQAHTAAEVKEIRGTVASLRLDAVLALGFGLSRSRAVLMIKGGLVQINGRPMEKPACELNPGDLIVLRGRGSLEVTALTGESRKGRLCLKLKKFSR